MKLLMTLLLSGVLIPAASGQDSQAPQPGAPQSTIEQTLVVDAGPCTADFVVRDASGKGVYNARITLQANYGFMGMRRLDLDVGTNVMGKARFEGLPEKIGKTAAFKISEGGREKTVAYDPGAHCWTKHAVTLDGPVENKTN